jgi:hypothetical protein
LVPAATGNHGRRLLVLITTSHYVTCLQKHLRQ